MTFHALVDPSAKPCKICGAAANLHGVVDFHKSCLESKGFKLSLSGIPVYYRRCTACQFVFTDAFDEWTHEDFCQRIYNDDYIKIDPDYREKRPLDDATFIDGFFGKARDSLRILDYGGGNGLLATTLNGKGYTANTFDPFSEHKERPADKADLITAFEVMEHAAHPYNALEDMISLLKPDGALFVSTLLQPSDFDQLGLAWWYVAPRNGHISIYSAAALKHLFNSRGLRFVSVNDDLHIACRDESAFITGPLRHLPFSRQPGTTA